VEHSGSHVSTPAQLVESAFRHQRSGNVSEAERLYRQALDIDPAYFDALHLFGLLAHQVGRNDIAAELIEKALQSNTSPVAFNNLGQAYQALARWEEAVRCYQEAIALQPDYVTAYNNLGAVLQESGRAAEAERAYRQALALRPDIAEVYCNLANALQDLGRFEEAEQACRQALTLNPGLAAAHNSHGNALQNLGRLEEAEQACLRALSIQPVYAKAYNNLGTILHALGRLAEAEQACRRAVEIAPALAMAYNNLGAVLRGLSRLEESEQALYRALSLRPDHAGTLDNLAVTLKEEGRLEEAKDASIRALAIDPTSAQAQSNLGVINMELGLFEEAAEAFRQALAICPDNGDAHWNLALLNLQQGDFEAGWKGYEWRLRTRKDPHGLLQIPRYGGSDLRGKTVFVYAEQGVGEELMFSSCLDDIAALADHSVFECDARLVPLFARSFPALTVIPATGRDDADLPADLPHMDFKLPLGSLPRYFRNSWGDFKGHVPWLTPCKDALQKWQGRYDALGDGLKVGIAWRGGLKQELSRQRSTNLRQWREVFAIPEVHFINLQYGDCSGELRELRGQCGTHIHTWEDADQLRDIDDFAAQVAGLDMVITIDNTTAHMAGALGTPVWCLLSSLSNWRWMLDCENSPWYPTMRLFRQKRQHDWESVFHAVARELGLLV
jgi:tetratricopeptide (TPR) repeat protein